AFDSSSILLLENEQMSIAAVRGFEEPERVLNTHFNLDIALLNRIIAAASTTLEPKAVLETTCRELALALDLPQAAAALLNEARTISVVVAEYLAEGRPSALDVVIPVEGNFVTQYVIEHKAPLAVADTQHDPRMAAIHDLMRQRGTVSMLILPLMVRGQMVGTLGLDAVERREFSSEEVDLAASAVAAAAQVLENARLFEAERQARRLSDTLSEIARELNTAPDLNAALDLVLSRMERVIAFDSSSILLLENEQMSIAAVRGFEEPERVLNTHFNLDIALLNREVVETRHPLIIASVADDPRWLQSIEASGLTLDLATTHSWMGVPLLIQDRVIGMLTADKVEPDFYQPEDAELALAFASHAAVTIEKARLFGEIVARNAELRRLNQAIEQAAEAVVITDLQGEIEYVNPAFEHITGYSQDEALGQNLRILKSGEHDEAFFREMWQTILAGEVWRGSLTNQRKSGELYHEEMNIAPVFDESGAIMNFIAIKHDVTKRLRAETALRESEQKYRIMIEQSNDMIWTLDTDGNLTFFNQRSEELSGHRFDDWRGKSFAPLIGRKDLPHVMDVFQRTLKGEPQQYEVGVKKYDGGTLALSVNTAPILKADQVIGTVSFGRDITKRKQAEEKIQRQLAFLGALHTIDMTISASIDLRITLDVLIGQVITQLGVDAAAVLLLNPHIQTLEYAAGSGFHTDFPQHTHLRLGEGCAGRAALQRRTIPIPDFGAQISDIPQSAILKLQSKGFSAYYGVPLIARGQIKGVLELLNRTPLNPDQEWLDFMETLATQAAIAIDNVTLFDSLQRSNIDLALAYDSTLEGWAKALELRDMETEGHSRRVTEMTMRLAKFMDVGKEEIAHIRRGALLHDIGKMGVPDSILNNPGPLDDEELDIMHQHPVYARDMLMPIAYLRPALDIPYSHHEKWDGSGYPQGLRGEEIPLTARIFAIVDVWDALNSDRPYREAWDEEKVIEYIRGQSRVHFDPQVVEAFLSMIGTTNFSTAHFPSP
ncbi:MAG: PAS domain S-box protein, partial [Chloroflexota bacterium]